MDMEPRYDYSEMSLESLADTRAWQIARLEQVQDALKEKVRIQYQAGDSIMHLSKKAGVTRPTLYAWLSE
tara:strand:+ start:825 stop:1034 length:210 start_codon:yes stop_codon:yes gene_type:complete